MQKIKSDTNNKITKLNNYKSVYKNGIVIIKRSFFKHNDGVKTCNKISKLTDKLIITLYKRSIAKREISSEDIIICAVGGYGREQLAPFSDLDILFIDAEGYDGDILIDFFNSSKQEPILIFEYIHIENKIFEDLINILTKKNYSYFNINENLICLPQKIEKFL